MNGAQALSSALFHSLWLDFLAALLAALTLAMMTRRSAAARHAVGMGFLILMALLPVGVMVLGWAPPGELRSATLWVARAGAPVRVSGEAGPFRLPAWLALAWTAGATTMLARILGGWWMVRDLLDRPWEPLPRYWQVRVERLKERHHDP